MHKVPIHWEELETSFERNGPDIESFLDLVTGSVVSISDGAPDANELRTRVAERASNYLRVEPASSREQYRWMEKFVASVGESLLRDRLLMAIDGKGAFRRFKDVLLTFPVERERWFTYRSELLHYHMQQWLLDREIESTVPAPWGVVGPPPELDAPLPKLTAPTESPGEVLRREARDLIDGIPALDLPAAIAFLTFLRERGIAALTGAAAGRGTGPEAGAGRSTTAALHETGHGAGGGTGLLPEEHHRFAAGD